MGGETPGKSPSTAPEIEYAITSFEINGIWNQKVGSKNWRARIQFRLVDVRTDYLPKGMASSAKNCWPTWTSATVPDPYADPRGVDIYAVQSIRDLQGQPITAGYGACFHLGRIMMNAPNLTTSNIPTWLGHEFGHYLASLCHPWANSTCAKKYGITDPSKNLMYDPPGTLLTEKQVQEVRDVICSHGAMIGKDKKPVGYNQSNNYP